MYNPESIMENETHKLRFSYTNGSTNLAQTTRPIDSQQKETCQIVDFAVKVDRRV